MSGEAQEQIVLIDKTIKVPKETAEAIDLIAVIAQKLKNGAKYSEFTDTLDEAIAALEGSSSIPAEAKSEHKDAIAAYLVSKVGGVFF